ncbi:MAG: hypothetical protein ACREHD_15540 [Pirellulales bacterium]
MPNRPPFGETGPGTGPRGLAIGSGDRGLSDEEIDALQRTLDELKERKR